MNAWRLFNKAAQYALDGTRKHFFLAAIGVRTDGAQVVARNHHCETPNPSAHAERRALRKCDRGSVIFVVRMKKDGSFALARPCARCRSAMRTKGIERVCYTISDTEYGVMVP